MMEFERIRGAIMAFHLCLCLMGLGFLYEVLQNGSPITPELYGARVYSIDAWIWSAVQIVACGCAAVGGFLGGRGGAYLTVFGALASSLMFSFLGVMALDAAQGTLIFYGSVFVTMPLATLSGIAAFNYLWRRDG